MVIEAKLSSKNTERGRSLEGKVEGDGQWRLVSIAEQGGFGRKKLTKKERREKMIVLVHVFGLLIATYFILFFTIIQHKNGHVLPSWSECIVSNTHIGA